MGGAFIAWHDHRSGVSDDVFLQHVTAAGAIPRVRPANGATLCADGLAQQYPYVALDALGAAVVAWIENSVDGDRDVRAARVLADGTVPALPTLMQATAEPGSVRLVWYGGEAWSAGTTVERREAETPWEELGPPRFSGSGAMEFHDSTVVGGRSYGYRLVLGTGGTAVATEAVWIQVPKAMFLASVAATPNPSVGAPTAEFSLPVAGPARLQMVDVRGRLVWEREIGGLGVGRHKLPVAPSTHLAPGVYTLQLSGTNIASSTRVVILR